MERFELFCFLDGGEESFPIYINETSSVAALRTAIKDEQRDVLGDIAASKLGLYQVSIAETAGAAIEAAFRVISKNPKLPQAVTLDEDPPLRLLPSLQLSHYFPARPEAGKVHILATIAPSESRYPRPCSSHVTENVSPPALYPPTTTFLLPIPAPLLPHSTHSLSSTIDVVRMFRDPTTTLLWLHYHPFLHSFRQRLPFCTLP